MDTSTGLIAVISAFASSPEEESALLRPFCGFPLLTHSLHLAKNCPEIVKTIVPTNSPVIAAEVEKLLKRSSLQDKKPLPALEIEFGRLNEWIETWERKEGEECRLVLTLSAYHPFRQPDNIMECFQRMVINGQADGIRAVSKGPRGQKLFSEQEGYLFPLEGNSESENNVFVLNNSFSIWRRDALRSLARGEKSLFVMLYEMPEFTGLSLHSSRNHEILNSVLGNPCAHLRNLGFQ